MRDVYILSGLGVDERVFAEMDFSGFRVTHLQWQKPERYDTMASYADRLIKEIKSPKPILIGLSFGGMMAIEIGKKIETEKIVLIASAKTRNEIPPFYRLLGKTGVLNITPIRLLKSANFITQWIFGTESKSDRKLLKEILEDTDPDFIKWALRQVLTWRNTSYPTNLSHIHGTADRLLPFRRIVCDIPIRNGGHFMTVNRAAEVSTAIKSILNET